MIRLVDAFPEFDMTSLSDPAFAGDKSCAVLPPEWERMRVSEWKSESPPGVSLQLHMRPALEENGQGGFEIRHLYYMEIRERSQDQPEEGRWSIRWTLDADDLNGEKIEEALSEGRCPAIEALITSDRCEEALGHVPKLRAAISKLSLSAIPAGTGSKKKDGL